MKMIKKTLIFCGVFIALVACQSKESLNDQNLDNLALSTEVSTTSDDLVYEHDGYYEVNTIDELMESQYIVKGKVVDILGPYETEDLINEDFLKYDDYFKFHTDIVIEVDDYLGEALPFEEIVVRREGGKIDDRVHITKFENFAVGEEVIIFNLENDPERYTQISEGYKPEQYFSLLMNTTFKKDNNNEFVRLDGIFEFDRNEKVTLDMFEEKLSKTESHIYSIAIYLKLTENLNKL